MLTNQNGIFAPSLTALLPGSQETVSEFRPVVEIAEGKKFNTVVKWRPKHYHKRCTH